MFHHLGVLIVRRRRSVLVATVLGLVVAIGIGVGVFSRLSNGGFDDPASESTRAAQLLADEFNTGGADLVAIVTAETGTVDDPTHVRRVEVGQAEETTPALGLCAQQPFDQPLVSARPVVGKEGVDFIQRGRQPGQV